LSPENEADLLLRAYARSAQRLPLVLVGPTGYETDYGLRLQALATSNVIFAGAIYGDGYAELSLGSRCFVLPAAIEATRLVLLDQMGFGKAVIFRDSPATREVIADAGLPFDGTDPEVSLARAIDLACEDAALCGEMGGRARTRAQTVFGWEKIVDQYEKILFEVVGATQRIGNFIPKKQG
jgi:glycosyltransferase involved in cell wall biosynthesis